jgi:hypothetical protein
MRIGFFLGSGVSLPMAPSTVALTQRALHELDHYQLGTDDRWRPKRPGTTGAGDGPRRGKRIRTLMQELAGRIAEFYNNRGNPVGCVVRHVNYEDIGFVADAIAGTLSRERDDPAVAPLIEVLLQATVWGRQELLEAADDTVNYLRDVMHGALCELSARAGHLRAVMDACNDASEAVAIYTLNHDCLIERALEQCRIEYDDLMRVEGDRRVFLPLAAPKAGARAILYKLHGSVNWRRFRRLEDSEDWFSEWIGDERAISGDLHDNGIAWRSLERPLFLLGRFNKELDYLTPPFFDLLGAFTQSLRQRDRVFVSGYGFGDKAVNAMLIEWVYSARGKRLIVLHEREEDLVDGARWAIGRRWPKWKAEGLLTVVPKYLCDCSWNELKAMS